MATYCGKSSAKTIMFRNQRNVDDNGVNGTTPVVTGSVSPGRTRDVLQVTTDRHQATRSNRKLTRISTWNVRTLLQPGKLDNVLREMRRMEINIMGLCEVRWTGSGKTQKDDYTMIYSGGDKHVKGVGVILDKEVTRCLLGHWLLSDRVILVKIKGNPFNVSIIQTYAPTGDADESEVNAFYETVDQAYRQCKSEEIKIVMGDMNAKVGRGKTANIVGPFGLGDRNERGSKFVEWCIRNSQVITNTWFKQHPRRLYTWTSPGGLVKNQIDYITINERFRNAVKNSKTYPGADCDSDHCPVVATLELRLRRNKKSTREKRLDYKALQKDNIRANFKTETLMKIDTNTPGNELWKVTKEALQVAARNSIPMKEPQRPGKGWMTEEILNLMEERRLVKNRDNVKYKQLNRDIRRKCIEAKERWFDRECRDMEERMHTSPNEIYDKVKKLSGKMSSMRSGCIRSEDGSMLTESHDITCRWERYIKELFSDNRREPPIIEVDVEGPEITKDEIRHSIRKMKKAKAVGLDDVSIEMLEALGDEGLELLYKIFNHIYDTGELPDDFLQSIFIAFPKKPNAVECGDHRTISIMSHTVKLLLSVILQRIRSKLRPMISDEQFGFMPGRGTTNAIFTLRMLCERAIQHKQVVFLCFIDYVKAFDKVRHEKVFNLLCTLGIDGKDIQLIRNLYWNQQAAVRVDDVLTPWIHVMRGLRQGCVQSPDYFNLYSETIFHEIMEMVGLKVGGVNFNNIRYADDTVLIATSQEQLQDLLDKVVEASAEMGLTINCQKTKAMVISKSAEKPHCQLRIGTELIQEEEHFTYLGSEITTDTRCQKDIRKRITIAKSKFNDMRSIFGNRNLTMKLKIRLLKCYIWSILTYGCEAWTLTPALVANIEAAEMWFLRRMLRISYVHRVTNTEVLRRAGVRRELMTTITERQLRFLGHVIRGGGLECVALQGRVEGRRSRGRQRATYLDRIKEVTRVESAAAIFSCARDRPMWRNMIAQACITHGT